MPDICEFINSKDVRDYLRKINYQFTAPEAAFVVYWSKRSVTDKIRAWKEIIHSMPDCVAQESEDTGRLKIASFHIFLREYMELLKRDIQNFSSGEGVLYRYKVYRNGNWEGKVQPGWYSQDEVFFSKYHLCVDYCKKHECCEHVDKIMITRITIDKERKKYEGNIIFNRNMEMINTHFFHLDKQEFELAMIFEHMCFPIPTPFRRGNILAYYETNEMSGEVGRGEEYSRIDSGKRPFVLSHIRTWNAAEMKRRGFHEYECPDVKGWDEFDNEVDEMLEKSGWHGVLSVERCEAYRKAMRYDGAGWAGMRPDGIFIRDAKGNLEHAGLLFVLYTDLEYYRKPLKGFERQLQVYSCYERGEIPKDLLVNSCFAIRMEEYYREVREDCIIYYPDEVLKQIGLLSADGMALDSEKSESVT